jgi:hypothetical protein
MIPPDVFFHQLNAVVGIEAADPDIIVDVVVYTARIFDRPAKPVVKRGAFGIQIAALRRELHAVMGPFKQLHADLFFKPSDPFADIRLGNEQSLGRFIDILCFGDRQKELKLLKCYVIQCAFLRICILYPAKKTRGRAGAAMIKNKRCRLYIITNRKYTSGYFI